MTPILYLAEGLAFLGFMLIVKRAGFRIIDALASRQHRLEVERIKNKLKRN